MVEEDQVSLRQSRRAGYLFQLATADQRGRVGLFFALEELAHHFRPRAGCKLLQFGDGVFSTEGKLGRDVGLCR